MTPSELKSAIEATGQEPHYFSSKAMRFFGDTMRNYGVRSARVKTNYYGGIYAEEPVEVDVWELYRKRPVKYGLQDSAYFCKKTLQKVFVP